MGYAAPRSFNLHKDSVSHICMLGMGSMPDLDAPTQITESVHPAMLQAMAHGMHPAVAAFLDIQVRRGHELEDALNQIVHRPSELKKPLRVTFVGVAPASPLAAWRAPVIE